MNRTEKNSEIFVPYLLIAAVIVLRLTINHAWNAVPVFACLLYFAASRPRREFAIPWLALVGVDAFLTTHTYGYGLTAGHGVTWAAYLATLMLGAGTLVNARPVLRAPIISLAVSAGFFVVSNFTVWLEWNMYPKTWSGLAACYTAALPFFRNNAVAETLCAFVVFNGGRAIRQVMPALSVDRSSSTLQREA